MNRPWKVQCLDSRYDEDAEMLVLFCFFEELGQKRVVCFSRGDFHYHKPDVPVPQIEMYKTAALFKGKTFRIVIDDDPNREKVADDPNSPSYSRYVAEFTTRIKKEMDDVGAGLVDEDRAIARKLGDIVAEEKSKKNKLSADDILAQEFAVRAKLNQFKQGD